MNAQIEQVNKEFRDSLLMELEEQGITTGTKVLVKTITWHGDEIATIGNAIVFCAIAKEFKGFGK